MCTGRSGGRLTYMGKDDWVVAVRQRVGESQQILRRQSFQAGCSTHCDGEDGDGGFLPGFRLGHLGGCWYHAPRKTMPEKGLCGNQRASFRHGMYMVAKVQIV